MIALPSTTIDLHNALRHRRSIDPVFTPAGGFAGAAWRRWRQMVEERRARRHLLELDDHLLRDIGLTRTDVSCGDFESLSRQRRAGGIQ